MYDRFVEAFNNTSNAGQKQTIFAIWPIRKWAHGHINTVWWAFGQFEAEMMMKKIKDSQKHTQYTGHSIGSVCVCVSTFP